MAVQTIHSPKEQQKLNVTVEPGQLIAFDFDISNANFERSGNDLTVSVEGGGQIVLADFFVADSVGALPPLQLQDGTQVASNDFLAAMSPELDVTPAAATVGSGGLNAYDASSGSLLAGLDGSDDQDSIFWVNTGGAVQTQEGGALADAGGGQPGGGPNNPPYTDRVVLFADGSGNNVAYLNLPNLANFAGIQSYNALNGGTSLLLNYTFGHSPDELTLTPDAGASGNQYDYLIIEYNDGTPDLIIQVVYTDGEGWDSAAENLLNPPAGGSVVNEWHTQHDLTRTTDGGRSTASDSADEMWLAGISARGGVNNSINTQQGVDVIDVKNNITAYDGSGNVITSLDAASSLTVGGTIAARESGVNTISTGTVLVDNADTDAKVAVEAEGGTNVITGASGITVNLNQQGTGTLPYTAVEAAVHQGGQVGTNTLSTTEAGASININVASQAGVIGLDATGAGAKNTLTSAHDVNITASGGNSAHQQVGVKATLGGANEVKAADDITLTVTAAESTAGVYGLMAEEGHNSLAAGNLIDINLGGSSASSVHGMSAGGDSGTGVGGSSKYQALNELAAAQVDMNLSGEYVYGMLANSTKAANPADPNDPHGNLIDAGIVNITAQSSDSAYGQSYGMKSTGGGENTIAGTDINITAGGGSGNYAMHSGRGGEVDLSQNLITAFGQDAMTVTLTATGEAGKSFAMYAEQNGLNLIEGSVQGDTITINGDIYAAAAGGPGVDAGRNEIRTGEGDDRIILDGAINSADALLIHGGDGYDTLVLKAAGTLEFVDRYDAWLQEVSSDLNSPDPLNSSMIGIEAVEVDFNALGDNNFINYLEGLFSGTGVDVIWNLGDTDLSWAADNMGYHFSGGEGYDSLDIGALHNTVLSDLVGNYSGFEHLELSGGQILTIDSLLDGLRIDGGLDANEISNNETGLDLTSGNVLRISGTDPDDKVEFDPADTNWSSAGTVDYSGESYDVYQNSDSSQLLLIQAGLLN